MANQRSTELPSEHNSRVSHTLCTKTASNLSGHCHKSISNPGIRKHDCSHKSNERPGGTRGGPAFPKLSVHNVFGTQERRLCKTHFQFKSTKSICHDGEVQPLEHLSDTQFCAAQRLALQNRFVAGIFSFKNFSEPQTLFTHDIQERTSPNDLLTVWSKHSPQNLRCSYELGGTVPTPTRNQSRGILGRLFAGEPRVLRSPEPYQSDIRSPRVLGMDGELSKVSVNSTEKPYVSRHRLGPLEKRKEATRGQSSHTNSQNKSKVGNWENNPQRASEFSGSPQFRQFCRPQGPPALSCSSQSAKFSDQNQHHDLSPNTRLCQERPRMVANTLLRVFPNSLCSTESFSNHRCIGFGLGGSIRQPGIVGIVERRRASIALQSEGNAGNSKGIRRSLSAPASIHSDGSVRQQNSYRLSPERRWNQVIRPTGFDLSSLRTPRLLSDSSKSVPLTGKIQCSRRPSVAITSATGVALETNVHGKSVHEMGNPCHRPLCIRKGSCCVQLRNPGFERSPGSIPRRLLSTLELPVGLGIPTAIPHTQSAGSSQSGDRDVPAGSSQVGEGILESRSPTSSVSSPLHIMEPRQSTSGPIDRSTAPQCPRDGARSVEVWGWAKELNSWNNDQVQLLESSWRPSTRKTYNVAWNRWVQWCQTNDCSPTCPDGSELAKFLADLHLIHALSYNTILVHKSVVCTLCNVNMSGKLSSHALVKHVMKSIALKKPKVHKPPVWNVDQLSLYLQNYSVDLSNVFQVSRHTAMLLLLSSGRRIHDLTLLSCDDKHCIRSDDCIIFWPIWGSKTDTSEYRQSGWKLIPNQSCRNLNSIFWINQLILLLADRRKQANCNQLFMSFRGKAKPASRAIIAGWVKSLLVAAGIKATPGSVRSAVASNNWLNNYPLEEILSRGNWRSANTFKNFYRREVMPVSRVNNIASTFDSID